MHRSITVRSDRARRLGGNETGRIEVQERITRRGSDRMSYKVIAIFYPDPEFWEKNSEYPDEEPYSWIEQKDSESLEEANAWVTNHYVAQDLGEYFATKGLRIQIASNLERDGMALEVLREDEELAAELFYSDADGSLTVTQVNAPFSAEDFQLLISTAKRRLKNQPTQNKAQQPIPYPPTTDEELYPHIPTRIEHLRALFVRTLGRAQQQLGSRR